jgi:hypothetical protein
MGMLTQHIPHSCPQLSGPFAMNDPGVGYSSQESRIQIGIKVCQRVIEMHTAQM